LTLATRRIAAHGGALALASAALLLFRFDPASSSFYPQCPVHFWLGVSCPGCGGTRALAALLHGRWNEAVHFNLLLVMLLPFVLTFLAASYCRAVRRGEFIAPTVPEPALRAVLVLAAIFTVVRNLPFVGWPLGT
jgi:hypothetical protein